MEIFPGTLEVEAGYVGPGDLMVMGEPYMQVPPARENRDGQEEGSQRPALPDADGDGGAVVTMRWTSTARNSGSRKTMKGRVRSSSERHSPAAASVPGRRLPSHARTSRK